MYYFYLGNMVLPITPKAVTVNHGGMNKSYTLIDDGEINVLKTEKLKEISFDFLLPATNYVFRTTSNAGQNTYLMRLKMLKERKQPFQFIIVRSSGLRNLNAFTNIKVGLEDYAVKEDAGNGLDMLVSVKLKEYRPYATKKVKVDDGKATVENTRDTSTSPAPKTNTTISVGNTDTLWSIAKQNYGSGDVWKTVAEANNITNPNELSTMGEIVLPVINQG